MAAMKVLTRPSCLRSLKKLSHADIVVIDSAFSRSPEATGIFRACAGLSIFLFFCLALVFCARSAEHPFHRAEILFPLETWHDHASCIVETPNADLLVCWFHGSGERTADDVKIEGARLRKGSRQWSPRFTMADTPGLPDGNPCMLIDPQGRLWFMHTTIQDNRWESALLKVRISTDYRRDGPPRWEASEVLHVKPGSEF